MNGKDRCANPNCQHWFMSHSRAGCGMLLSDGKPCQCAKFEEKAEQPKDVQEVLRRALEREKEHEQEKKERMRNMPLAPSERDW